MLFVMVGFSVNFHILGVFYLQHFSLCTYLRVVNRYVFCLADDNTLLGVVDDYVLDVDVA